ncbi:hypothetical protein B0T26DRAFT_101162 [Lasiosphaeria miniovina]|uniref:Uncharacterized protein n=1 Tax=Lasiosphaeria miniovina TaxID=1954250 RepID=A0AA40B303_9PEZI|nr:uncharacterized protein B0T26DRAFT_101162 [Lasiosphaeria miniovina]KAK0726706.1 hypothetical protein B0T26DRAFT_101162 [Lasiosphaeria miniovina]
MFTTRSFGVAQAAPRAARSCEACLPRVPRISRKGPQRRLQSSGTTGPTSGANSSGASHISSGVAGGLASASLLYGIWLFTPSGKMNTAINKAAREANTKYQQVASTMRDKAPSADEAVDRIRQICYAYVGWIPGGRQYVDTAFHDFDTVRESHRDEVDKLVDDTYRKFQDIAKSGLNMETLSKSYDALTDLAQKLAKLTGSAAEQILENHPQLKDKVGEPMSQLKQMGEKYGPEAKKMVDETWDQVGEVMAGGFTADNANKVKKMVEEKLEKLRKLGDQVWEKGLEQARPYLDKSPRVKQLIMDNQELLKQGNASALFKQAKSAVESGDTSKLEDYIKKAVDKAKSSTGEGAESLMGGGSASFAALGQFLGVTSHGTGEKIQQNMSLLTDVVKKHSDEGERLLEETKEELKRVLEDKAKKAQQIVDKAKDGK